MKKVLLIQIIVLLFIHFSIAQDRKVAVFDPAGNADNASKEIIREEIISIIVNIGGITVVERHMINKVFEEYKFQQTGLVDETQISEIGKAMGANLVFVTNLTENKDKNYHISCKLIDVETARIDRIKTAQTIKGSSDLISTVQKLLGEMFGQLKGNYQGPHETYMKPTTGGFAKWRHYLALTIFLYFRGASSR